jgi:hypothetical protein
VKIWQPYVIDDDEQLEKDEIARNRIIWERLSPATDFFLCFMNGKRIEDDEPIEHGDRVLIGHRDEVEPDWWHPAMREMKERQDIKFIPPAHWLEDEEEDPAPKEEKAPESAQPAFCLPSSRLDQHEGKAQVDVGMETSEEESNARGKSDDSNIVTKDCTVVEDLHSQLSILRESIPDTRQAIITYQNHSVHMLFSPENAIADFKRKVKELWNIPTKMFYLLVNCVHESLARTWSSACSVSVKIRGLGAGPSAMTKVHRRQINTRRYMKSRSEKMQHSKIW